MTQYNYLVYGNAVTKALPFACVVLRISFRKKLMLREAIHGLSFEETTLFTCGEARRAMDHISESKKEEEEGELLLVVVHYIGRKLK